jgi:hypothetical protein
MVLSSATGPVISGVGPQKAPIYTMLNTDKIPKSLHYLIEVAEKFRYDENADVHKKIEMATDEELIELVKSINCDGDDSLCEWLSGPESYSYRPTDEYLAFSDLLDAYDYAKLRLSK